MLSDKKTLTNILDALNTLGSEEELATGAHLIRFSNLRVLNLNVFKGANSTLTIPEADRPSHFITAPMFRTNTSDTATAVGYVAINSSNGYVQRYYGGQYNGTNGVSNIGATDKVYAVAVWIVGGVIRTLKKAISNLIREEVVVC